MRTFSFFLKNSLSAVFFFCLMLVIPVSNAVGEVGSNGVISSSEAVNVAGRQRMLTQRITKAYLLIGSGIGVEKAEKQRDDAVALFTKQLAMLKVYAPVGGIADQLAIIEHDWKTFRKMAMGSPNKSDAVNLVSMSDSLLARCHQVVLDIVKLSSIKETELVNMSGRQRMLTQRIAKFYTSQFWGVNSEESGQNLKVSVGEFEKALAKLMTSELNTKEISHQLERVENQWKFSKVGFQRSLDNEEYVPLLIASTMESILSKMENIVKLYEVETHKISREGVASNL